MMNDSLSEDLLCLLRSSFKISDALTDLKLSGPITIRLSRDDGLKLLALVSGSTDPRAERYSQHGRPSMPGLTNIEVAGVTFAWPARADLDLQSETPSIPARVGRARMKKARPANDNAVEADAFAL
jgi:hypothetical protein